MEWNEILAKHETQWEEFAKLKDRAWQKVVKDNEAILAAFGDDVTQVPDGTKRVMDERGEDWVKRWGMNGHEMKTLQSNQQWERRAYINERKREFIERTKRAIYKQRTKEKKKERESGDDEIG